MACLWQGRGRCLAVDGSRPVPGQRGMTVSKTVSTVVSTGFANKVRNRRSNRVSTREAPGEATRLATGCQQAVSTSEAFRAT
jgi:hypothetical protein